MATYQQVYDLITNDILNKSVPNSITNEEVSEVLYAILQYTKDSNDEFGEPTYKTELNDNEQTTVAVGNIPTGVKVSQLKGKQLNYLFDAILYKIFPTVDEPTVILNYSLSPVINNADQPFTLYLAADFYKGLISNPWNNTTQGSLSGEAISYVFIVNNVEYLAGDTPNIEIPNFTGELGSNTMYVKVIYGIGLQPVDKYGDNFKEPYPAGEIYSEINEFYIENPLFVKAANGQWIEKNVVKTSQGSSIELLLAPEQYGGAYKQAFRIPTNTSTFKITYPDEDNTDRISDFNITTKTIEIRPGKPVEYNEYVYEYEARGLVRAIITFD